MAFVDRDVVSCSEVLVMEHAVFLELDPVRKKSTDPVTARAEKVVKITEENPCGNADRSVFELDARNGTGIEESAHSFQDEPVMPFGIDFEKVDTVKALAGRIKISRGDSGGAFFGFDSVGQGGDGATVIYIRKVADFDLPYSVGETHRVQNQCLIRSRQPLEFAGEQLEGFRHDFKRMKLHFGKQRKDQFGPLATIRSHIEYPDSTARPFVRKDTEDPSFAVPVKVPVRLVPEVFEKPVTVARNPP